MKTFEYKDHTLRPGKKIVRTNGIVLPRSKGCTVCHLQADGKNYNVYVVTKQWLENNIDTYHQFIPQFNWID